MLLRIAGLVIGGGVLAIGLLAWFVYLGASLTGFDSTDTGPGVTNKDLIEAVFKVWLMLWLVGVSIVLVAVGGWLRHTVWLLSGSTGVMLVVSLITYVIGAR